MANSKHGGMIFLEPGNKIVAEAIRKRLDPETKPEPCDVTVADFDDCMYHVVCSPDDLDILKVSIAMRALDDLRNFGGEAMLEELYPDMITETETGYDLTLQVNVTELPEEPEVLVKKFSQLQRNLLGAPFMMAFQNLLDGTASDLPPIRIDFREKETMYVCPSKEQIAIVFALDFVDATDSAIARVFLQEFSESVRRVNSAPPCSFSRDPPGELKSMELREGDTCIGYLTFSIFKLHVDKGKLDQCVTLVQGFRNYLLYHIKASKSHLHTRMRARVKLLQQILNRAVPEDDEKKEKKLMSGRTFVRK